ncbi:hypothetical protein [Anaerosporobacter sp.]|uniref:hypothetical protein n=1 Tax=Anaerosporobacter sp. TaxID=1872529 RepID=UPI00286F03E1|nr:hypothetical protein [Anaerosporobacter sp.]
MSNDTCKCSQTTNEYMDFLTNNFLSYDDMYRDMINSNITSKHCRFRSDSSDSRCAEGMAEEAVENVKEALENEDSIVERVVEETNEETERFNRRAMSEDMDLEELINEYKRGGCNPYCMPIGVRIPNSCYEEEMPEFLRPNHREVEEETLDDDINYMKGMYPRAARRVLESIEDECDKLEYAGSCMFDEFPDRTNISRIILRIYENVRDLESNPENEKDGEVETKQYCGGRYCPNNRCVDCYDDGRPNWLYQLIQTMLFQEMINRRRRYRYRRWR